MAAKARLEARATLDDANFQAGLNRLEARTKSMSDRVTELFRRARGSEVGEIRAERALSGFFAQLTTGNLSGAIESITYRLTGMGLAVGVGIGIVAIGIAKLGREIVETDKAAATLRERLSHPVSALAGLGIAGLSEELKKTEAEVSAFAAKYSSLGAQLRRGFLRGTPEDLTGRGIGREKDLQDAIANSAVRSFNVKRIGLQVSEREAAIAKINLEYDEKRSKITLERGLTKPGRSALDFAKELAANEAERRLTISEQNRKGALRDIELKTEEKIAAISASGLPAELQKTAVIEARIVALQRELAITTEIQARREKEKDLKKLQGELGADERAYAIKRFEPLLERAKFSMPELLGMNERQAPPGLAYASHQARMAEHEENLGEIAKAHGDQAGAFGHFMEAEKIKSRIGPLSDKEKAPEYAFRAALQDTNGLLMAINASISGLGKGSGANDFANQ